jgi:predicted DNA-binding transcriptional regulator AlpA
MGQKASENTTTTFDDDPFDDIGWVEADTNLSRSTIYREISAGRFPPPHQLSPGRVGWSRSETRAWKAARLAHGRLTSSWQSFVGEDVPNVERPQGPAKKTRTREVTSSVGEDTGAQTKDGPRPG